jgi:hypothetical protein
MVDERLVHVVLSAKGTEILPSRTCLVNTKELAMLRLKKIVPSPLLNSYNNADRAGVIARAIQSPQR